MEMSPVWLKPIYSVLCALIWRLMPEAARSRLCCRVSAWAGALHADNADDRALLAKILIYKIRLIFTFPQNTHHYYLHRLQLVKQVKTTSNNLFFLHDLQIYNNVNSNEPKLNPNSLPFQEDFRSSKSEIGEKKVNCSIHTRCILLKKGCGIRSLVNPTDFWKFLLFCR